MPSSRLQTAAAAGALALACVVGSCAFSVAPTTSTDTELTIELSAFPGQVSVEDTSATSEIWATVRIGGSPVRDNTIVKFATTAGKITSQSQTVDGLAVAILRSPGDNRPRQAEVVAQAITVRDTLNLDFVIVVDENF